MIRSLRAEVVISGRLAISFFGVVGGRDRKGLFVSYLCCILVNSCKHRRFGAAVPTGPERDHIVVRTLKGGLTERVRT